MKKQNKTDKPSYRAAEISRYTKLAKDMPDVRKEKIEAIRKQIAAGTYEIPAESIAQSIANLHNSIKRDGDKNDR